VIGEIREILAQLFQRGGAGCPAMWKPSSRHGASTRSCIKGDIVTARGEVRVR